MIADRKHINNIILDTIHKTYLISITDEKGTIIFANPEFCLVSGYTEEELIGQDHRILNSNYHCKLMWKNMWKKISKGEVFEADIVNKAKDKSTYCVRTKIFSVVVEGKKYYISLRTLINDILEIKKRRERIIKRLNNL